MQRWLSVQFNNSLPPPLSFLLPEVSYHLDRFPGRFNVDIFLPLPGVLASYLSRATFRRDRRRYPPIRTSVFTRAGTWTPRAHAGNRSVRFPHFLVDIHSRTPAATRLRIPRDRPLSPRFPYRIFIGRSSAAPGDIKQDERESRDSLARVRARARQAQLYASPR